MLNIIIALLGLVIAGVAVIYFLKKKQEDADTIRNLFTDRKALVNQNLDYSKKLQQAYKEIESLKKKK